MKRFYRQICALALILLLLFSLGQLPAPATALTAAQPFPSPQLDDPQELEAFIDGLMAAHFLSYPIAGATISVVKDGEILLAKGYGYADVEKRLPVGADTTLFRIGSTTKLFTWTAVMQLVEAGLLDLNSDVNNYLTSVQVPATFAQPVTMAHLMAHTAGFEESFIGLFAHSPEELAPLALILANELPARIRPPGEMAAYSNHGVGLAGLVVADISGLSWEEYVETHILRPLGMDRSTAQQPIPEHLAANMSQGYRHQNGRFQAQGFEYVPTGPDGAISATAVDMAHFMLAHLQDGRLGDAQILQPATVRQMHQTHYQPDLRLPGIAHGFMESDYYGLRLIGHGGDTFWFHTAMELIPAHHTGIFVSYNSEQGALARSELIQAFVERYFVSPDYPAPPAGPEPQHALYSGSYLASRTAETRIEKVANLLQTVAVRQDEGYLVLLGERLVEVEPHFFRQIDGPLTALFEVNEQGAVTQLHLSEVPMMAFTPVSWWETPAFHALLLLIFLLLILSTAIGWPIRAWRRRHGAEGGWRGTAAGWLAGGGALLLLLYLIGFGLALSDPFVLAYGVPPLLRAVTVLPWLAGLLALGALIYAVRVWREAWWSRNGRIHYTLILLTIFAFIGWLNYWNLLWDPLVR
jgi:CubicO group peptidase (beta-lactamase class C family)